MTGSHFRLFVAGAILLGALIWGGSQLVLMQKRATYVRECMGGYELLRSGCEYSAKRRIG